MNFQQIVGHEDIIRHFKSSIEMDMVSHAYIINGEAGSGKKMLARTFAATLQCEKGGTEPCGCCASCIQMETGNHPDVITLRHEKSDYIKVDEVRSQIVEDMGIKPYKSKYKIYIIPDAQLMRQDAQNILLKTMEEPPAYGVLILLTTNLDKMIETVQSRCMILNTKPIRERDMLDYLKNTMNLSEEKAYFCLDFAQGNLGKAIKLAQNEEYAKIVDSVVNVLKNIQDFDVEDLGQAISSIKAFQMSIDDYFDLMMMWYRDMLLLKVTGRLDKVLFKDEYMALKKQAARLSYKAIEDKIDAVARAKQRLDVNAKFEVTMELLLLTLKEEY